MLLEEKNGNPATQKIQRNRNSAACAGTIIDNRTIVTAARCVSRERFMEWFGVAWENDQDFEPTVSTTTTVEPITWSTVSTTWSTVSTTTENPRDLEITGRLHTATVESTTWSFTWSTRWFTSARRFLEWKNHLMQVKLLSIPIMNLAMM